MLDFYSGKRVFITGHTGFKGSWLCLLLALAGAEITGFALPPAGEKNLFTLAEVGEKVRSVFGDIRDLKALKSAFDEAQPEIVLHLAAQPIVREGYRDPAGTYCTNVMGTVHILECVRLSDSARSFLNVTTDKVYQEQKRARGYRETDVLNGFDPYSNSKSCSELVTASYRGSFLPMAVWPSAQLGREMLSAVVISQRTESFRIVSGLFGKGRPFRCGTRLRSGPISMCWTLCLPIF